MLKIFLLLVFVGCASCANILFVAGIPSPSHHIFNKALAFALADRGHNVTMIGNDVEKEIRKHFHFILMEGAYEDLEQDLTSMIGMDALSTMKSIYIWAHQLCPKDYVSKGLKQLFDYPEDYKFDLVVFDVTFGQCLYPLIERFHSPPVVAITAFLLPHYLSHVMGNYIPSSYYPHYELQLTNKMSFFERILNLIFTCGEIHHRRNAYAKTQNELMKKKFGENTRTMEEVERTFAVLLANTDPIVDYPVALPPNIIPVGGMHVKPPKPLPKDLSEIFDRSKDGVILFSLGSNIQLHLLPQEIRNEFIAAFSKLKQTVIWKYDREIEDLPKNIVLRKWLPQNDILGHPNCKLFISHGGGLSTFEATYHGVPVVGIPGFADQHRNIQQIVSKGLGLRIDFGNIKRDVVFQTVSEVLENPKYADKMKKHSAKFRDQPQTPMDRAVFWTEYVLRHGTGEDLSLPARDMSFYQTSNADVILFSVCVFLAVLFGVWKCVKMVCCPTKSKKVKTK